MTDETSKGIDNDHEERTREIEAFFREETRVRAYAKSNRKPSLDDYDENGE
jgi:hypothetical protein